MGQAMQEAFRRAGYSGPLPEEKPPAEPSPPEEEPPDDDPDQEDKRPSSPPQQSLPRWAKLTLALTGVLVAIVVLAFTFSNFWTEFLWFQETGYVSLFWARIWGKLLVGAIAGAAAAGLFLANVFLARRLSPRESDNIVLPGLSPAGDPARRSRWIRIGLVAAGFTVALFFGLAEGSGWEEILLFFHRIPVGYQDPLFGKDASFFIHTLPFIRRLLDFSTAALICTFLGVLAVYALDRAARLSGYRLHLAPYVKGHISVLAALLLVCVAVGFIVSSWELVHSPRGVVFGAGYTDTAVQLPVMRVLALVALVSAIIFLLNIYYRGWRLPLIAVGFLTLMWLGAGQVYPAIVQQYRVSPNEIEVESPYIANNIDATRFAYGLDRVQNRYYPALTSLNTESIEKNRASINNMRLWDSQPLLEAVTQQQELRLYYHFRDVDIDRYEVSLRYRQIMLAARELDHTSLLSQAKTWVNEHLTYTHGYGVVISTVNSTTADGLPEYLVSDIPPQTITSLEVTRPAIYYGEVGNEFVIVNTKAKEFDYPGRDENQFTTYTGTGGIPMESFWKRAAFALRFGDLKLLASEYLTPESRIMFRRTIRERAAVIAPFLQLDGDPYIVLRDDGTLIWMWDAYTTTSRFPYSEPRSNGVNYIRNSVKMTIDAYDGSITLYLVDSNDSLAATYDKSYPGLLRPANEMPEDLRRHMRYPQDLFALQAQVLSVYHMQDPQMFYNKEDVWQIPNEIYSAEEIPMAPYYAIMTLPGEEEEEFLLMQPFVPLEKSNMVAWMTARMDGDHYGELLVYELAKDKLVFGPAQVEARISNDPVISAQLALWNQAGSQVIRGNLLVIPVEESLLYVEPLFLQAEQQPIPELKRVIVSYGERVVMEPTLSRALERMFGADAGSTPLGPSGGEVPGGVTTSTTTTTVSVPTTVGTGPSSLTTDTTDTLTTGPGPTDTDSTTETTGDPLPTDRNELIALAAELYTHALEAQRVGDWSEYGRLIQDLGRVLATLQALTGP
ncbi:MAG: UPF0182 family protein [Actinobacteria bacterium]|nr:UPF0182 family protein [Actinomycetota bacterium]